MYSGYLDTVTNKSDWNTTIQIVDSDSDEPVDLTGVDAFMQVVSCREGYPHHSNHGYGYDYGSGSCGPRLSGSTEDGRLTLSSEGIISWSYPASVMNALCPRTYDIGIILKKDDQTTQLFLGKVTVLDGVVTNGLI